MPKQKITPEQISQGLLDARELMNRNGDHWIKGRYSFKRIFRRKNGHSRESCYCAIGAIRAARPGRANFTLRRAMIVQLETAIRRQRANDYIFSDSRQLLPPENDAQAQGRIIGWNDSEFRKWGDVSRAFRMAARRALKNGSTP